MMQMTYGQETGDLRPWTYRNRRETISCRKWTTTRVEHEVPLGTSCRVRGPVAGHSRRRLACALAKQAGAVSGVSGEVDTGERHRQRAIAYGVIGRGFGARCGETRLMVR